MRETIRSSDGRVRVIVDVDLLDQVGEVGTLCQRILTGEFALADVERILEAGHHYKRERRTERYR